MRQWRFRAAGTQVRAGAMVGLRNDAVGADLVLGAVRLPEPTPRDDVAELSGRAVGVQPDLRTPGPAGPTVELPPDPVTGPRPPPSPSVTSPSATSPSQAVTATRADIVSLTVTPDKGPVTLYRAGSSPRPVCGGDRVALHLAGAGYLAAGEPGDVDVVVRPDPAVEWVVTGVAPGVAVPVARPVGLFDTVQGDHLVCRPGPDAPVLGWASSSDRTGDGRVITLPMPPQFRPPEGVPGDVELSGAVIPVRDGDLEAGLLLLLDPADGRSLGGHLMRRAPALAEGLVPDAGVGAVACRWSSAGGPSSADPPLPPAGSRLWVQGLLVCDPGVSLRPVRALAWALNAGGEPVTAAPGDAGWPQTVVTWRVLLLPQAVDVAGGPASSAFYLPLPGRDGEPGTATTLTPASGRGASRYAERRTGGWGATSPALIAGATGSRRLLRIAVAPVRGGRLVALGCTVRVHLPGSSYGSVASPEGTA